MILRAWRCPDCGKGRAEYKYNSTKGEDECLTSGCTCNIPTYPDAYGPHPPAPVYVEPAHGPDLPLWPEGSPWEQER